MSRTVFAAAVAAFFLPLFAFAEEVRLFDVHITPYADGSFAVVETITYDFKAGEDKHGIFRHITKAHPQPASAWYQRRSIDITLNEVLADGASVPYEVTDGKDQLVVKIGDPNKTVTDLVEYQLQYRVYGGLSYYNDDITELYWNVTGHEWEVPIRRVEARVDATTGLLIPRRFCYAGVLGETQSCESIIATSTHVTFNARFQGLGSGLTIAQELNPKLVAVEIVETTPLYLILSGIGVVWLVVVGLYVYRRKTEHKPDQPLVSQYEPLPQTLPMFSGVLIDGRLDSRDITAGLMYLAQQGYVSIRQTTEKVLLLFETTDYEITLKKDPATVESEFLYNVLTLLFTASDEVGTSVKLSTITRDSQKRSQNAKEVRRLETAVIDDLVARGYFDRALSIPWAIVLLMVGLIVLPRALSLVTEITPVYIYFAVAMLLTLVVAIGFAYQRRTRKGYEAMLHLKGFKEFLSVTEQDRMKFHNAPAKNPQQFMEYLPYAVAFGVEEEWARVFKDVQITPPEWYSADGSGFSGVAFARDIAAFTDSFSGATTTTSGSGSSGGGFSGGGAGGGGGGSW